jgi:hypothetical protein
MSEHKALCPGCKTEAIFADVGGGIRKCLCCGFQFSTSQAPPAIYSPALVPLVGFPAGRTSRLDWNPAAPNKVTSLDAAMTLLFYIGRHRRGASEFNR